jgi:hypothetical protein
MVKRIEETAKNCDENIDQSTPFAVALPQKLTPSGLND